MPGTSGSGREAGHASDGRVRTEHIRWSRKQTELYEATNGAKGGDLRGRPVIVLTSVGAKTGKLRKTALMRVEHEGVYAVVASLGGAPKHPVWYYNLKKHPHVELQDGATKLDYTAREVVGDEKADLVGTRGRDMARLREVPDQDGAADPGVRAGGHAVRSLARSEAPRVHRMDEGHTGAS